MERGFEEQGALCGQCAEGKPLRIRKIVAMTVEVLTITVIVSLASGSSGMRYKKENY